MKQYGKSWMWFRPTPVNLDYASHASLLLSTRIKDLVAAHYRINPFYIIFGTIIVPSFAFIRLTLLLLAAHCTPQHQLHQSAQLSHVSHLSNQAHVGQVLVRHLLAKNLKEWMDREMTWESQ